MCINLMIQSPVERLADFPTGSAFFRSESRCSVKGIVLLVSMPVEQ